MHSRVISFLGVSTFISLSIEGLLVFSMTGVGIGGVIGESAIRGGDFLPVCSIAELGEGIAIGCTDD